MSKLRLIPLPLKGVDARASTGVDPETLSYAEQVRSTNQDIAHLSTNSLALTSPSGNVQVARNIIQAFFSAPGGPDQNRLYIFTNAGLWISTVPLTGWSSLETGYGLTALATPGGSTYARFAIANSSHKLAWTATRATTPLTVRILDGQTGTITPITPAYSADHLIAFNHRIVIANTVEAGVRNAARIRWSANRNFTDWSGVGSGFMEVGSNLSSGAIRALVTYDQFALVSLENEIIELIPTNSLFPVFEEGNHYIGTPIVAAQTWQVLNHVAYFVGPDSIYAWDHNKFTAIGRPIERLLKPYLDPVRAITMQAIAYPARNEYHVLHNEGVRAGTSGAGIFIYDITADRWFADTVPAGSVSAIGRVSTLYQDSSYVRSTGVTPQEFTMRTNSFDTIGFEETPATYPVSMPVGLMNTQDILAVDRNEQPALNAKNECLALYFYTRPGQTLTIGYSVNGGVSYSAGVNVTANSEGLGKFPVQVSFSRIRFSFRAVSSYFYLTAAFQMEYEPMGDTY